LGMSDLAIQRFKRFSKKMNNKMRIKFGLIVLGFLFLQAEGISQGNGEYFYDTLTIMDYETYEESVMLSRLKKPITRNFYLKADGISYSLFKNQVANLDPMQISDILSSGFSLYIDKREHQGHKNLVPSILEILDEDNEVVETIDLNEIKSSALGRKLAKDALFRFSGFIISVNENKFGPISMDVRVVE